MDIKGLENISPQQLDEEIMRGGKFVYFEYCISILIIALFGCNAPSACCGENLLNKNCENFVGIQRAFFRQTQNFFVKINQTERF